ncbi:hypothetical protein O181_004983 [Austropuccinia psidii MF-1]|uniref:HAT C-terminal dimerisation domain-containing protein n=1 Tax=Austropuccinia psidii MF-1 TaxID=1389203 RepID=A0A9Q3BHP1_9BASI|nr:hypothetical protein [Austropuccinia psidii MF-1]
MFEDESRKFVTVPNQEQHDIVIEKSTCLLDKIYLSASLEGSSLELELQRYLAKLPEPKDTHILLFWKSQGKVFPTLVLMACNYLAIPATIAPSESVFSGGRRILSYQRASLTPFHVEQLACVKDWACTFGLLYNET